MISSGIRIGAWEFLKRKNIIPIYNEKRKIIAAKIIVYDGEPERYFSFISPQAYDALKGWMDFRAIQGEKNNSRIVANERSLEYQSYNIKLKKLKS